MPKTIYIPEDARHSGIDLTWTPSAGRLDIGGWYDTIVGIQPGSMTLAEFFAKLGITEKDVRKALSANAQAHSCAPARTVQGVVGSLDFE